MDIERHLQPRVDELIIDAHGVSATIYDAELDPLTCVFCGDATVIIDASRYDYIELSIKNLNTLKRLIKEADILFDSDEDEEE